ncbi:putative oligosaccharyltransferase complex subunit CG9662 [Anastrepha obliqua]|uniref:putative oligosaccharyltransferase complex subunit CG9662 n=1 Tax=Anastrepha ludens TaxID=28586 RepID=UPI0023AE85D3|nr:putative oligosaccharyltransferase complex subunit CG9662 [Anastrepha ludens]XP_054742901.1 putative oligosaccharyltransferase complex subunit CG9662 [Anastrepha obliqua]
MIETLYNLPFQILVPPNIKIRRPAWFRKPSPMAMFSIVLLSYFLVTGGIIYDVIVEPPSVGATVDEHGHSRPVAFMPYRVNGQYIMEGLASSFLFTIGGLGFIIMDQTHIPGKTNLNRFLLTAMGFIFILVSFFTTWLFMRMKLPSYLQP